MIYITTRNITRLADMYVNGLMTWSAATTWANNLDCGGFSQQYCSYDCTGGELSGLFVTDLGNKANESVLNQTGDTAERKANLALFSNMQSRVYWSGTKYAPNPDLA